MHTQTLQRLEQVCSTGSYVHGPKMWDQKERKKEKKKRNGLLKDNSHNAVETAANLNVEEKMWRAKVDTGRRQLTRRCGVRRLNVDEVYYP